jgi:hypothetical protein
MCQGEFAIIIFLIIPFKYFYIPFQFHPNKYNSAINAKKPDFPNKENQAL